jgi:Na+/proline symporter
VVLFVLAKVGGPELVFSQVSKAGPQYFDLTRADTAVGFGIATALGLIAVPIVDQSLWQKAWAIKPERLARSFLWAGAWFYSIPITIGLLGFVGIALGVKVPEHIGDPAAVGPFIVSHLGLTISVVVLFTLVILNAAFSTIDSAFSGLTSVVAVDIVKPLWPGINDRKLFLLSRLSIVAASVLVGIVVLLELQFVDVLLFMFAVQIAFAVPIAFAVFWSRYSSSAFISASVLSLVIGLPVRLHYPEPWGTVTIFAVSVLTSLAVSLLGNERFDFARLSPKAEAPTS